MAFALDTVVWDNHACMPLRPGDTEFLPELESVKKNGVDVVTLNIACGAQSFAQAKAVCETYTHFVEENADWLCLAETVDDIEATKRAGKLAICFDVEGGDALDGDAANVQRLYAMGVRWLLPTYNQNNALGGGCLDADMGLTQFGRDVLSEMNRVGMVICGSHCGPKTAQDLISYSTSPTIFSHSNASALCTHPRNISDDLMRAYAENGGVVGICGFSQFLGNTEALEPLFAAHIDHALHVAGEDHVGLALDYVFDSDELDAFIADNPHMFPPEVYSAGAPMLHPRALQSVYQILIKKGWHASVLAKVFGLNHLRVAREVWKPVSAH